MRPNTSQASHGINGLPNGRVITTKIAQIRSGKVEVFFFYLALKLAFKKIVLADSFTLVVVDMKGKAGSDNSSV